MLVNEMQQAAHAERLFELSQRLEKAGAERNTPDIARLDHAIRNTAIAMIGGGAPVGKYASEQVLAINVALQALQSTVERLSAEGIRKAPRHLYIAAGLDVGSGS